MPGCSFTNSASRCGARYLAVVLAVIRSDPAFNPRIFDSVSSMPESVSKISWHAM
ncbi:hypothetical protein D3C83_122220 [compost metagenome]